MDLGERDIMMNLTNGLAEFMQLENHKELFGLKATRKMSELFNDCTLQYSPRHLLPIMPPKQQIRFREQAMIAAKKNKSAVYIHIPFCKQRCSYCNFCGYPSDLAIQEEYVDLLCQELSLIEDFEYYQSQMISAVFIGGGSPSALNEDQLERLLSKIRKVFLLESGCEFTFESNITDFNEAKLAICLKYGVNRFSFGVQTFSTDLRRKLGRLAEQKVIVEKLKSLAQTGVNVIVDLIYGLPGQTMEDWQKDLEFLLQCNVTGVDLYKLQRFPHSILEEKLKTRAYPPCPAADERMKLYERGASYLQENAWQQLSCCHFTCGEKDKSLYNKLAKNGSDIFAFGAGAGGSIGELEYIQVRDLNAYKKKVEKQEKPFAMVFQRDHFSSLFAKISGQLDCGYLDLDGLEKSYAIELKPGLLPYMKLWENQGLCISKNNDIMLTTHGKYWMRWIARFILCGLQYAIYGAENSQNKQMSMMSEMMNLR